MIDEDLELMIAFREKRNRFIQSKETKEENPEEYQAAKADFSEFRRYWRSIRDAFYSASDSDPDSPDATAVPTAIDAATDIRKGK